MITKRKVELVSEQEKNHTVNKELRAQQFIKQSRRVPN